MRYFCLYIYTFFIQIFLKITIYKQNKLKNYAVINLSKNYLSK